MIKHLACFVALLNKNYGRTFWDDPVFDFWEWIKEHAFMVDVFFATAWIRTEQLAPEAPNKKNILFNSYTRIE